MECAEENEGIVVEATTKRGSHSVSVVHPVRRLNGDYRSAGHFCFVGFEWNLVNPLDYTAFRWELHVRASRFLFFGVSARPKWNGEVPLGPWTPNRRQCQWKQQRHPQSTLQQSRNNGIYLVQAIKQSDACMHRILSPNIRNCSSKSIKPNVLFAFRIQPTHRQTENSVENWRVMR